MSVIFVWQLALMKHTCVEVSLETKGTVQWCIMVLCASVAYSQKGHDVAYAISCCC